MLTFSAAQILAFVLVLLTMAVTLRLRDNRRLLPFVILAALAAMQACLVSLRWDFGITSARLLQIMLSCVLPSMSWLAFRSFTAQRQGLSFPSDLLHLLPLLAVMLCYLLWSDGIDAVIVVANLVYGVKFLQLTLKGEDELSHAALGGLPNLRRALWFMTFSLLGSVCVDVLVVIDFIHSDGLHAPTLIAAGNLVILLALVTMLQFGASAVTGNEPDEADASAPSGPTSEDSDIANRVRALLDAGGLATEPDLTLNRIARRLTLPVRSVSRAINMVHGRNVSQFVNEVRIAKACEMLRNTDTPITRVIYDSGFQTKSNFNREFLRVTGKTPRDWRNAPPPN